MKLEACLVLFLSVTIVQGQDRCDHCGEADAAADAGKRMCGGAVPKLAQGSRGGICGGGGQIQDRFPNVLQPVPEKYGCKDPCSGNETADEVTSAKCDYQCSTAPKTTKFDFWYYFFHSVLPWPFPWICDNANNKCCTTCIIKIPFRRCIRSPSWRPLYVVWCPLWGGFQWYNHVFCPHNKKCRTRCKKQYACRSYLVTYVKPHPTWGHCFNWWLPTWFQTFWVPNHCVCPAKKWSTISTLTAETAAVPAN